MPLTVRSALLTNNTSIGSHLGEQRVDDHEREIGSRSRPKMLAHSGLKKLVQRGFRKAGPVLVVDL
jgi:hypothetical protein